MLQQHSRGEALSATAAATAATVGLEMQVPTLVVVVAQAVTLAAAVTAALAAILVSRALVLAAAAAAAVVAAQAPLLVLAAALGYTERDRADQAAQIVLLTARAALAAQAGEMRAGQALRRRAAYTAWRLTSPRRGFSAAVVARRTPLAQSRATAAAALCVLSGRAKCARSPALLRRI